MSSAGAASRAAVSVSNARAEASRRNGAKSRGPKTPEGKARSAQNALKHGLRAAKHVVLPEEDVSEFAELEAALIEELAPVGTLQTVLARRVAVRLAARAGRSHRGRAGRGTALRGRQPRSRADPRRQWASFLRDFAALSRRGHGGVLARPAHAEGPPGRGRSFARAPRRHRACPGGASHRSDHTSPQTKRTPSCRAPCMNPSRDAPCATPRWPSSHEPAAAATANKPEARRSPPRNHDPACTKRTRATAPGDEFRRQAFDP
jgi:hypothetical protein